MTEPTELLPCPFCGAAAHFEMDEGRWEWVECESCGMQGNRSASLMEDCKPKLAEAWNRRTPAPVGVEPYGWHYWNIAGTSVFHLGRSSKLDADIDASREHPEAHHVVPLYTTPQPVACEPLVRQLVEALEGYRRNHNDTQPCDAERAGRAWLEGKPCA